MGLSRRCFGLGVRLSMLAFSVAAADLERDLEQQLRGAWAVILGESSSDCAGVYNNNEVGASFSWVKKSAPKGHSGGSQPQRRWREGWDDGQELVFNPALADRLRGWYVQPPLQ